MDTDAMWILGGTLLIALGGMEIVIGGLAHRGWLPHNRFVRFLCLPLPSTKTDDQAWKRAQRAAGDWLSFAGLACVVAGMIQVYAPEPELWNSLASLGAVVLALVLLRVASRRGLSAAISEPEYSPQS
jgi:peptidoglycan/LPS O-acetylase OafA/YrhL